MNYKFEIERLIKKNNEILKQKIDLLNENEELKQRISKLVSENTTLQNDLFSEQLLQDETDDYIDKLKTEIIELKTKLYDSTVKEQRLLKILKETSD